ncbi:MAG: hypothetical protein K2O45_08270 [Oscillospiraceae bacterium]|nr:hypothetical protein [Oscillospiraceae bacterium]
MKKTLSLVLALLMTVSLLAGCGGNNDQNDQTDKPQTGQTGPADGGQDAAPQREHVTVRFAQFGNNLDDADGYANDPIRKAIEEAVGITLEYDTGTEGFDDRMETEL